MSNAIESKGVSLAVIFDPYVSGTSKARASGIDDAGNDTSNMYANLIYGSAAAATGIQSEGADLNTLYAAYGTAHYSSPLPIDGTKYSAGGTTVGAQITIALEFSIASSGWAVIQNIAGTQTTLASGSVPSGATSVQLVDTWLDASGDTGAGTNTNTASSYTSISSAALYNVDSVSAAGGSGTHQSTHSVVINMKNSAGSVISITTITFVVNADGE